jgi:hypothetical protein
VSRTHRPSVRTSSIHEYKPAARGSFGRSPDDSTWDADRLDAGEAIGVEPARAVEWLRAIGNAIQRADVPVERAELVHAIYETIVIARPRIVSVRLTPSAYAHGLALALPEKVVMARPTGVGHADFNLHHPDRGARRVAGRC